MSEEEKKAVEYIRFKTITGLETLQLEKDVKAINIVLNLIEKLQKENKELKENNENLKECVISWQSAFKLIENQNIKFINEYLKK